MPRSKGWELVKNRFLKKQGHGLKFMVALIIICFGVILLLIIFENITSRGAFRYLDYGFHNYLDYKVHSFAKWMVNPTGIVFVTNIIKYFDKYIILGFSVIFLIYFLLKKEWWSIVTLCLSVGGGAILIYYLKMFFYRRSPILRIMAGRGYAFPSGHAFFAMIIFGFMILLAREFIKSNWLKSIIYFLCTLLILLIGVSLIVLNHHWFTEVLGGYCAGFLWLLISILLVKFIRYPWETKKGKGYENGVSF